ncbi:MAG: hypothetical protein ACKOUS_22960, partial [Alphaproteobacteria bacterium]
VGAVMGALGYARALGGAVCAAAATALVLALAPQGGELRGLDHKATEILAATAAYWPPRDVDPPAGHG